MNKKLRTVLVYTLVLGGLLLLSSLLLLAIDQALLLTRLYTVSAAPGPASDPGALARPRMGFWVFVLVPVALTTILFVLFRRHPRRLMAASILVLLIFVALNLYSGRHVLPQVLIWPRPAPLLEKYTEALAADDLQAALSLTDGSGECNQSVANVFPEHQALLEQRLGAGWQEAGVSSSPHRSIMTYYEKPLPETSLLQPVPTQLVRLLVRRNGESDLAWLVGLRVRYKPFLGTRYICGEGMDPEGWRYR